MGGVDWQQLAAIATVLGVVCGGIGVLSAFWLRAQMAEIVRKTLDQADDRYMRKDVGEAKFEAVDSRIDALER